MDKLPAEIISNILKYLPLKDLLVCTTVCHRFNAIIESYRMIKTLTVKAAFVNHYWYNFYKHNEPFPEIIRRKYSKLIIRESDGEDLPNLQKALESTGKNFCAFKLSNIFPF